MGPSTALDVLALDPSCLRLRPCFQSLMDSGAGAGGTELRRLLCLLAIDLRFADATDAQTLSALAAVCNKSRPGWPRSERRYHEFVGIAQWRHVAQAYPTKCARLRLLGLCSPNGYGCGYASYKGRRHFENQRRGVWREVHAAELAQAERFLRARDPSSRLWRVLDVHLRREAELDLPPGALIYAGARQIADGARLVETGCSEVSAPVIALRCTTALDTLGFIRAFHCGKPGLGSKRSHGYQLELRSHFWSCRSTDANKLSG